MDEYLSEFVQDAEENITALNNDLLQLEREPDDREAMDGIFRVAHTIKGNAGAMGFTRASTLAHAIEDVLDAVRAGEIDVSPDLMDHVFEGVDVLETMIDEVRRDGTIETDPESTIASLHGLLEDTESHQRGFEPPTDEEIDATLGRFDGPSDEEFDVFYVRLAIAESESVNNGVLVVEALVDAFDVLGTNPPRSAIENESYGSWFDAVFATAVGEAAIAAALEPVDEVRRFDITRVTDRLESTGAPADGEQESSISESDAQDLSVDELLEEFEEFDDLDSLVEDVGDVSAFDDMGEAGSFADLLGDDYEKEVQSGPGPSVLPEEEDADAADDEVVEDANAVFQELKQEVEMVGFDELQEELAELEFDEFDSDDEVGFDELLGDDYDADDDSFLDFDGVDAPEDLEELPGTAGTEAVEDEVPADEAPAFEGDDVGAAADVSEVDTETTGDASISVDASVDEDDASVAGTGVADASVAGTGETDTSEDTVPGAETVDAESTEAGVDDDAIEADAAVEETPAADDVTDTAAADAEDELTAETAADEDDVAEPAVESAVEAPRDAGGQATEDVDSEVTDEVVDDPATDDGVAVEIDGDAEGEPESVGAHTEGEPLDDEAASADASADAVSAEADAGVEDDDEVDVGDVSATDEPDADVLDDEGEVAGAEASDEDGDVTFDDVDTEGDVAEVDADASFVESDMDGSFAESDANAGFDTDDDFDLDADDAAVDFDADEATFTADAAFDDEAFDDEAFDDDGFNDDGFDDSALDEDAPFGADESFDLESSVDLDDVVDSLEGSDVGDDLGLDDLDIEEDFDDEELEALEANPETEALRSEFAGEFGAEAASSDDESVGVAGSSSLDPSGSFEPEPAIETRATGSTVTFDEELTRAVDEAVERVRSREEAAAGSDDGVESVQSVRVSVEQLDSLMNLVEGLVTSRVRLRHSVEGGEPYDVLDDELDDLEDITTELQEAVMDARLLPLGTITGRLPRLVRDLARSQNKEVSLEIDGEDVELDRSVLDRIGDPLVHLVRNAADHGIESPAEREDAGKPREGVVEVRASRTRDRVTIEVADDGAGLDPDRLRSEAVESGIYTEPEVDDLSDESITDLVFHPGLSTADEVTDVSGRGVGMDVVKRTVEDLEGDVTIESEPGEGTTVRLSLPVTIAIADVLFLESGGERFGVPVKDVNDVAPAVHVERVDGEERFVREDGECPLVRLERALDTPEPGANGDGIVVRIRDEVRPVAIQCDQVHGQQEVVIKPFEGFMADIPGLSGATVRGRGDVVNILDVTTL